MGHPDGQAYADWRGPVFQKGNIQADAATPFEIGEPVTNYASVLVRVKPTTAGGVVIVNFYTDSTQTDFIDGFSWTVTNFTGLNVIVPVLGNFMVFEVTTTNVALATYAVTVAPLNIAPAKNVYPVPGNVIRQFNVTIANGASLDQFMPYVAEGDGFIHFRPYTGGGTVTIKVLESDQANNQAGSVFHVDNPGAAFQSFFSSFTRPLHVQIINTGGVNMNVDVTCGILSR